MNPWRDLFPLLRSDPGLAYLDSAASTQKFSAALDAERDFYERDYANVHRGVYSLAERATAAYDHARETVASFFGALPGEIVFTRGTTESINLVARSLGETLGAGDEVVLTEAEHHANIVPWLMLEERRGIVVKYWPADPDGLLRIQDLEPLLGKRTRLVSFTAQSNVTGQRTDPKAVADMARSFGALSHVDAAQAAAHASIRVKDWDVDLLSVSGHKMYGPMGSGILYGRADILDAMPPFMGGGDMIASVRYDGFEPAESPRKFEAGTPSVAQAVGLAAALEEIERLGRSNIVKRESGLARALDDALARVPGVRTLGPGGTCLRSFVMAGAHPHDVAQFLDSRGIAVRAGHHCAQPLHKKLGFPATVRASIGLYNSEEEIDRLAEALLEARRFFS